LSPLSEFDKAYHKEVLLEIKRKRIKKAMIDKGIEPPTIIEAELSSADDTSDSAISESGLPDADLKFVVDPNVSESIEKRRTERRLSKIRSRIDYEAINSVL